MYTQTYIVHEGVVYIHVCVYVGGNTYTYKYVQA